MSYPSSVMGMERTVGIEWHCVEWDEISWLVGQSRYDIYTVCVCLRVLVPDRRCCGGLAVIRQLIDYDSGCFSIHLIGMCRCDELVGRQVAR